MTYVYDILAFICYLGLLFEMAAAKLKILKCKDGSGPTYIVEPFGNHSSKAYDKLGDALLEGNFYSSEILKIYFEFNFFSFFFNLIVNSKF